MKIYIFIILIISYIFLINLIPGLLESSPANNNSILKREGGEAVIRFSDSVSVVVERNRIYGRIYEINGNSWIYLLDLIKLPLKYGGINYLYFHIFFLSVLIYFFNKRI